jgi:hypothetical protein
VLRAMKPAQQSPQVACTWGLRSPACRRGRGAGVHPSSGRATRGSTSTPRGGQEGPHAAMPGPIFGGMCWSQAAARATAQGETRAALMQSRVRKQTLLLLVTEQRGVVHALTHSHKRKHNMWAAHCRKGVMYVIRTSHPSLLARSHTPTPPHSRGGCTHSQTPEVGVPTPQHTKQCPQGCTGHSSRWLVC